MYWNLNSVILHIFTYPHSTVHTRSASRTCILCTHTGPMTGLMLCQHCLAILHNLEQAALHFQFALDPTNYVLYVAVPVSTWYMLSKFLPNKWTKEKRRKWEKGKRDGRWQKKEITRSQRRWGKSRSRKGEQGFQKMMLPGKCTEKVGVPLEDRDLGPIIYHSPSQRKPSPSFDYDSQV